MCTPLNYALKRTLFCLNILEEYIVIAISFTLHYIYTHYIVARFICLEILLKTCKTSAPGYKGVPIFLQENKFDWFNKIQSIDIRIGNYYIRVNIQIIVIDLISYLKAYL